VLRPDGIERADDKSETAEPVLITTDFMANDRYLLFKPTESWHLGEVLVPGYYNVVMIGASWCAPCGPLRVELDKLSRGAPGMVVIDVDASDAKSMQHFSSKTFASTSSSLKLPSVFVFDQSGLYVNRPVELGRVAGPMEGPTDEISGRLQPLRELAVRPHAKDLLRSKPKLEEMLEKKLSSLHYAKLRAARSTLPVGKNGENGDLPPQSGKD
jgi:thiol-disulfide isomerase/thioredoxin